MATEDFESVIVLTSVDDGDLERIIKVNAGQLQPRPVVLNFHATWVQQCAQMNEVFGTLAREHRNVLFVKVNVETHVSSFEKYGISAAPSFVLMRGEASVSETLVGVRPRELSFAVQRLAALGADIPNKTSSVTANEEGAGETAAVTSSLGKQEANLRQILEKAADAAVVFADKPCEELKRLVSLHGVELVEFNVDECDVRDIVNTIASASMTDKSSSGSTLPAVFANGRYVGNAQRLEYMSAAGQLPHKLKRQEVEDLVKNAPLMIFIKGSPEQPRCGFTRQLLEILEKIQGLKFGHFDILSDETVRQELKVKFNWPTFPQVYVKGELIGGLDIVRELVREGQEFQAMLRDAGIIPPSSSSSSSFSSSS